jgi:two-component system chemotaxis response regulator CheB
MKEKIKVIIVDDSALFRQLIYKILIVDPGIEVIATAADPFIAAHKMESQAPDVIVLDSAMPRMNGITFLKKIMSQHPLPVIFLQDADSITDWTTKAFQCGAVEVLSKEMLELWQQQDNGFKLCEMVKSVAQTQLKKRFFAEENVVKPKLSADAVLQQMKVRTLTTQDKVIAVGASTGGTEAIRLFLEGLPEKCPGIVIVQHMPENFTKSFAERLNELCNIVVKEAENGDLVTPGKALIAPGNRHVLLKRRGTQYYVELNNGPLVNRHRPSVDVLFRSAANYAAQNCIGILLTGMGDDGAKGLLEIREAGGRTIAQDEHTCVVFGMPKEAIQLNAVEKVLPIGEMSTYVMQIGGNVKNIANRA